MTVTATPRGKPSGWIDTSCALLGLVLGRVLPSTEEGLVLKRPVMPHAETCGGTRGSILDCLSSRLGARGGVYRIAGRLG